MNRRDFLQASALTLPIAISPQVSADPHIYTPRTPAIAGVRTDDFWKKERTLWLRREVGTGAHKRIEECRATYWGDGHLDINNYVLLCHILRDVNEDQTVVMNPALLDLLYGLTAWQELELGRPVPAIITSGFRTKKTNKNTEGAALLSKHQEGCAADSKSPFFSHETVAKMALFLGMGGVGRYDTHTHIDVAKIRQWDYRKK
jgi:uncharacterized protein YcbK (DUF882 family)